MANANQKVAANVQNVMDGRVLLSGLDDDTIKACFFDPQYPTPNANEESGLPPMGKKVIATFMKDIDRVLVPSGYLFLWMEKEQVLGGIGQWLNGTLLHAVDLITWNSGEEDKQSEYLVVCQKIPVQKGATLDIADVWEEKITKRVHPFQKPSGLLKALVLATTKDDDYILDPCAGSYAVLDVCKATKRDFIGCDLASF